MPWADERGYRWRMITASHGIVYSDDATATRAFFKDVLRWSSVCPRARQGTRESVAGPAERCPRGRKIGDVKPVVLELPFRGRWMTQNSPARRVPSHGTDLFGVTYAIDFVAVDGHGRSAPRTWRSWVTTESPHLFRGFGLPILAPEDGIVVEVHDGEVDHEARRSPPTLLRYALTQPNRVRQGIGAIAGNHVVIALSPSGPYVGVVHLRRGSVRVGLGDRMRAGSQVGECGNSGNSTEPHVHIQVTDSVDWTRAVGLPLAFRGAGSEAHDPAWIPDEGEIVDGG